MRIRIAILTGILTAALGLVPVSAQSRDDYPVAGGWFYSQANGKAGGGDVGYTVTNNDGITFYDAFQRFGGVSGVGYPVSDRFQWKGFTVQAFQKVVFQWRPEANGVAFVNVFDEMTAAGKDDYLLNVKQVPKPADWSSDTGKPFAQVVADHNVLLDQNPAIRQVYFSVSDPINENGLPMSAQDFGNVYVIRAQRKVFQQWKVQVPWAQAGQVVVANGGDVGKEAGLYPTDATVPKPAAAVPSVPTGPSIPPVVPAVPSVQPVAPIAPVPSPTSVVPQPVAPIAPSPTSVPAAPPANTTRSIYQVGETAVQNGGALTLTAFRADVGSLLNPRATLVLNYAFTNNTGRDLAVTLSPADFVGEAMGQSIPAASVSPATFSVPNGGTRTVDVTFTLSSANLSQFASVTEIVVTVRRFAVMENIRWNVKVR